MSDRNHRPEDLHAQTARISWQELEIHFARGVVVQVDSDLDLVAVATAVADDDRVATEGWIAAGLVARLDTQTAKDWAAPEAELWAVVVAPWVLVQDRRR